MSTYLKHIRDPFPPPFANAFSSSPTLSAGLPTSTYPSPALFKIHPHPTPYLIKEDRTHSGRLTTFVARLNEEREFNAAWDRKIKTPFDFHAPPPRPERFPHDPGHEEFQRACINPFHPDNFPFFFSSPSIFLP